MKKLLLTLTTLSLMHTAQAEIMEGNVTIQFKITRQLPATPTDKAIIQKESVTTFKNADFIQAMSAVKGGEPFSKSAKLMFLSAGSIEVYYFIRDKGKEDFVVMDYLSLDQSTSDYYLMKGTTYGTIPQTGNMTMTTSGEFTIRLEDPEVDDMILKGPIVASGRAVKSKEDPTRAYAIINLNISGYGRLLFQPENLTPDKGLIQGTIKLTPGRVLPTPTEEPEA